MRKALLSVAVVASSLLSAGALLAAEAPVDAAAMKKNKTVLMETAYPEGHVTSIVRTLVPADAQAPLHQHPGIESGYILSGGGTLHIKGQPDHEMKPGDTALVPPYTPHWFKNGHTQTVIVSTYVLESGKPAMEVLQQP